jgi:hypothetical protein
VPAFFLQNSSEKSLSRDHAEVLEPENHGYEAITLGAKQRWTILAKVLWWIAKAP